MYPKEKISELKGNLKTSLQSWAENKIDELCKSKLTMRSASVYMKRGVNNWLEREDERINNVVDNSLLFVADKDGNVDVDTVVDDLVDMFKQMEVQEKKLGMFNLSYGKGEVILKIPHNVFLDMLFGDLGQIRLTSEDLLEIKSLLNY